MSELVNELVLVFLSFVMENPGVVMLILVTILAVYFTAKIVMAIVDYYWGV